MSTARRPPVMPSRQVATAENPDYDKILLSALMNNLPDHIYFKDRNSRFTEISKAMAVALGLTDPADAIGRTDFDYFAEEHAARAFADEQEIMKTGMPIVAKEEKEAWPDGRETWVSTTKAPLRNARHETIGTFGVSRDITAIKKHQAARQALEAKMQHADKMESLGMLASGIAHDFNNLLMGILGNASLALEFLPENSPSRSVVKQIEIASHRAADLTNQLLAYSGRGAVVVMPIDLGVLVKEMAYLLEVSISKNVSLRFKLADDLPSIDADVTQIRQVIMNLITNASDAVGDGLGSITIGTGAMDCDEAYLARAYEAEDLTRGRYVYLEVSDTGCGMDRETMSKIFDPFFTTKPKGRGLGLATVYGAIRGHKGAVKVYSEPGVGTTFRVLFRVSEQPAEREIVRDAPSKEWRGSGAVLVADDEETIRDVTVQMLELLGFRALTACSGQEAVAVFGEHRDEIVAVLLDEVMPRMHGEEVYAELRRIMPDVRVILCSGYTEQDATSRFPAKQLAGFIQKPFSLDILAERMRRALEQ